MSADDCRVIPKHIEAALDGIEEGFYWRATPQGEEYWRVVVENLKSLMPVEGVVAGSDLEKQIQFARAEIAKWPESVKRAMKIPV
jgi:hypothetical protein